MSTESISSSPSILNTPSIFFSSLGLRMPMLVLLRLLGAPSRWPGLCNPVLQQQPSDGALSGRRQAVCFHGRRLRRYRTSERMLELPDGLGDVALDGQTVAHSVPYFLEQECGLFLCATHLRLNVLSDFYHSLLLRSRKMPRLRGVAKVRTRNVHFPAGDTRVGPPSESVTTVESEGRAASTLCESCIVGHTVIRY